VSARASEHALLARLAWPRRRLGDALAALAERARLVAPGRSAPAEPALDAAVEAWLAHAAAELGLEAELVSASFRDAHAFCRRAGPALFELAPDQSAKADEPAVTREEGAMFLAVLGARGRSLRVLRPVGRVQRVRAELLRSALEEPARRRVAGELERLCDAAGIGARRRARASPEMARQRLADQPLARAWLVRGAVGTETRRALR
jgi:hypothetical protein